MWCKHLHSCMHFAVPLCAVYASHCYYLNCLLVQVLAFDAFCQNVTRDMQAVLAMLDTRADPGFGRPPLSVAAASKPPVISGLNVSLAAALDAESPTSSASSTPPPDAHMEIQQMQPSKPFVRAAPSPNKACGSAGHSNASAAAPLAAAPPTEARSEELFTALGTLPEVLTSSGGVFHAQQQQAPTWFGSRRRSFDVAGVGHRRPLRPVNSRTNLLSAVGGSRQDPML